MATLRSSRCVFNTATALHRVFIAPIELSQASFRPSLSFAQSKLLTNHQRRPLVFTSAKPPPQKARLPRDEEIQEWSICLVTEDGKLSEPRSTYDILQSISRKTHSLITVALGEPGQPPICKIMDKKVMRDAEKAKVKNARASQVTTKTIELNWAIDGNDLRHRLDKMKSFLEKGSRVEVVLAPKRKGRKATEEEGRELLGKIKEVWEGVEGAKESKDMEGKILGTATVFVEGKRKKGKDGGGSGVEE